MKTTSYSLPSTPHPAWKRSLVLLFLALWLFDAAGIDYAESDVGLTASIQSGGGVVVAGRSRASSGNFPISRYRDDGQLDPDFGVEGKLLTHFPGDVPISIVFQPDGSILAAGVDGWPNPENDFVIARYLPDFSRDLTFGGERGVRIDFDGANGILGGIAVQPDGKLLASGSTSTIECTQTTDIPPSITVCEFFSAFAMVRLLADGSLDQNFGEGGVVAIDIEGEGSVARSVALQGDGKILIAGSTYLERDPEQVLHVPNSAFAVLRYESDGLLDELFSFQ